jgi:hypothetical protein
MSHLHVPRVCIKGQFEAGGVTANNVLAALNDVNTPGFDPTKNGWHNNNHATNQFSVLGSSSQVVGAWDEAGRVSADDVLGALVSGDGVMADLDPEHRRVTDLFGFRLVLWAPSEHRPLLTGTLRPTQLRDFWVTDAVDGPVFGVSTIWQSVLTDLVWSPDAERSRVLSRLRGVSRDALSVRLTMTLYNATRKQARGGTLLAVIGPHHHGEPTQLVPGRRLTTPRVLDAEYPGFPAASFIVDERRRKLVVDLCNLVPRSLKAGARLLTNLTAKVGTTVIAGPVTLTVSEWLASAGLVEWDLTAAAQTQLAAKPVVLDFTQDPDGQWGNATLAEDAAGRYVDVDRRSVRLNPKESVTVPVYARQFGKPLAGQVVDFKPFRQAAEDPIISLLNPKDPYYPSDPQALINGEPANVFDPVPPYSVKTDAKGRAELRLKVKPGPFRFPAPRKEINSQLYFLGDPQGWQLWGAPGPEMGKGCALTVLVFNTAKAVADPKWDDVAPILKRYARMYPVMTEVNDLGSEARVRENAGRICRRLTAPIEAVEHMPITRDLSAHERDLIVRYLKSVMGKAGH